MTLEQATPVLLCSDIERTAAWLRDAVGFETELHGDPPNFLIGKRDGQRIMYALSTKRIVPNWHVVENMWNVYLRTDDVDVFYAEMTERGTAIDYSLCNQPWGMREFGIQDPDGHDIGFGQPLA